MQVTLTKISRKNTDKEGNPLKTKDGRPYTRVAIKTSEHGDKWLSGFANYTNERWVEGQKVDIEVEEKGEYLNFKALSETAKIWIAIKELQARMTGLENADLPVIKEENLDKINEEAQLAAEEDVPPGW